MDINKLKGIVPDSVIAELPMVFNRFKIDTPLRLAHFLATCDHESGGFKTLTENLNYSADRLLVIFPKYFKNINEANAYGRNPQKIANKVYGNRMLNGNEASGDGFKFRGRGAIMITGKANYAAFDKFVDDDILNNPDLLQNKYPILSAAWFWDSVKLNSVADKGDSVEVTTAVRKKVNGGVIGLADCISKFNKYYNILK
jgi:putative chitinase